MAHGTINRRGGGKMPPAWMTSDSTQTTEVKKVLCSRQLVCYRIADETIQNKYLGKAKPWEC